MFKVLIVDDEQIARLRLKNLLAEFQNFEIIGEAADGISAINTIEKLRPDIVFLDIEMPELNGIEVANSLDSNGPLIVFVTAYDEYAVQAFETNAIDYLLKPINKKRFSKTIERIQSHQNHSLKEDFKQKLHTTQILNRFVIKVGSKLRVINSSEISMISAQDHYACFTVGEKEYLSEDSLDNILQKLNQDDFMRIHRSTIINVNFLKELKREGDRKYVVILNDSKSSQASISRDRLPSVKKFLGV